MEALIERDTAGSPVEEGIRWTNRSAPDLADELQGQGFQIGVDALRRILFEELGLSRRQAFKDESACHFPQRDETGNHFDATTNGGSTAFSAATSTVSLTVTMR